ncbi:hypothetical protein BKA82DRAFT_743034 [Pisolithus tinctorius]|uniref:Uncharacterized protein n=1 Tax=Pisolithus tinctorius Marx 270 TaxID=870435 RepID=A0A0C3JUJ8_PISTI|nr:hypothetical protein BKA82DRAFT_743034 [Pisolithus tinctorius]KIO01132.1 hypothetical protein M404DRAFT_743034 [Pisolithus tinctorius Marx 270]
MKNISTTDTNHNTFAIAEHTPVCRVIALPSYLLSGIAVSTSGCFLRPPHVMVSNIHEVATAFFQFASLSHKWGDDEPLLRDVDAELQEAIRCMFACYRRSAATIVHLSDVSNSASLADSI